MQAIRHIQKALKAAGFDPGPIDGYRGSEADRVTFRGAHVGAEVAMLSSSLVGSTPVEPITAPLQATHAGQEDAGLFVKLQDRQAGCSVLQW